MQLEEIVTDMVWKTALSFAHNSKAFSISAISVSDYFRFRSFIGRAKVVPYMDVFCDV